MSKNRKLIQTKSKEVDIEKEVMSKVSSGQIVMKPKWLFVVGSIFTMAGLVGLIIGAIFLTNLTIFLIRKRGPGFGRLELLLESFPIWIPIMAVLVIFLGVWMLKKYDFSYKKNFLLIIITFIVSVIIAGLLVDQLGLNSVWSHQRPFKRFYQQLENQQRNFLWFKDSGRYK